MIDMFMMIKQIRQLDISLHNLL